LLALLRFPGFSLLVFVNERKQDYEIIMLFVGSPFGLLNQLTDFHDAWYERYASGVYPNLELLNFTASNNSMQDGRTCESDIIYVQCK
jgi:hypothetical protein